MIGLVPLRHIACVVLQLFERVDVTVCVDAGAVAEELDNGV